METFVKYIADNLVTMANNNLKKIITVDYNFISHLQEELVSNYLIKGGDEEKACHLPPPHSLPSFK